MPTGSRCRDLGQPGIWHDFRDSTETFAFVGRHRYASRRLTASGVWSTDERFGDRYRQVSWNLLDAQNSWMAWRYGALRE